MFQGVVLQRGIENRQSRAKGKACLRRIQIAARNEAQHEQAGESRVFTRKAVEWSGLNRTESGRQPARQAAGFQQSKVEEKSRCLPCLREKVCQEPGCMRMFALYGNNDQRSDRVGAAHRAREIWTGRRCPDEGDTLRHGGGSLHCRRRAAQPVSGD